VIAGGESSGLAPEMWVALTWALLAMNALGLLLFLYRYRLETMRAELDELHRRVRA
jgi:hypothetical protein